MREEVYSIKQFIMIEVKEGIVIQNEISFTLLEDDRIISFFKMIDEENRLLVSRELLDSYFGNETNDVIEFLIQSNLISQVVQRKKYKRIKVYTNDKIIFESFKFNTADIEEEIKVEYSYNCKDKIDKLNGDNSDKECLYVVVLNPFDYIDFIRIVDKLSSLNLYTVIGFAYNSKFYMTNLYKKEWYNPCPKCFFSQLEASLRSKARSTNQPTFQTIVDLIYNKEISFQTCVPTNRQNVMPLIFEVIGYRKSDVNATSNRVTKIDLQGEVNYDQSIHWELCDCFE